MQQTRLNELVDTAAGQIELLFNNPWRRISLNIIALLMGFFMGSAIVSSAGQDAVWDITGAAVLLIFAELSSRWIYGQNKKSSAIIRQSLFLDILNKFKIGITYSLFLEAFKLNS
ncbi:Protein of unknown function (DUF565) [Xenococcus sp. PCC 7305]|uniref:DUF565 domain-containing protein n=1 Tax=Xenococcus sp. PCC 7305 TaxID=102125 RepID=UPI0002ABE0E6|nr:DUF565 domain-containing protein [Xenococcus sp. PCC 7305]ELS01385.1 Protein of unknown function (DUF565) [Xenococcus sp. PCC 7305]